MMIQLVPLTSWICYEDDIVQAKRFQKEGETTSMEKGYFSFGRRGDSWPKDQAECERD